MPFKDPLKAKQYNTEHKRKWREKNPYLVLLANKRSYKRRKENGNPRGIESREIILARNKAWRLNNPEKAKRIYQTKNYKTREQKLKKYLATAKYERTHKEVRQKYFEENKAKIYAQRRERYKKNKDVLNARRRAKRKDNGENPHV